MIAFLFDLNRCTGCQACELACMIENQLAESWRQVVTYNPARHPAAPVIHLSLACNHCVPSGGTRGGDTADAPCMQHCPALAYSRDASGRVNLDAERCIGCKYCSWACPYDAPRFDAARGVMTKCTFCGHRQDQGLAPACVEQCPTGALGFGDLSGLPGAESAPGMPTVEPGPAIRFIPWRQERPLPEPDGELPVPSPPPPPAKITLRSEWPLAGFTLIAAALVAALAAAAAGRLALPPAAFLGPAVLGTALSSLHLGQKRRAWRAVANLRRSWLSREVVLYAGFVGLGTLALLLPGKAWLAGAAALAGFAALFAMDRVYDLVRPRDFPPVHSADVFFTGALATALLLGHLPSAALFGVLKLALYVVRKVRCARRDGDPRWGWSLVRLGLGFALPLALGLADPARWPLWALAGTAAGELVDRGELYAELEVPTPRGQMARELASL